MSEPVGEGMSGLGEHVMAMVRSHASGDEAAFYSVALQIAAREARRGHHVLASDIVNVVDASRRSRGGLRKTTILPQAHGDISELATVTFPRVELERLVAPAGVIGQLKQVMAEHRQRQSLLSHGFTPAHRLLLEGPPGTGKTMTASVLATELSLPLVTIRLDSILSKFMGEAASKLRQVFDAVAQQPGVYLFDEFDALGADRSGNDVGEARRILNSFLVFLEETSAESIVVAATNHRSILDKALFRRFDVVVTYSLPDARQAESVIRARLGSLLPRTKLGLIGDVTKGLSHAELVKSAESAAKAALMRGETLISREELLSALEARRLANFGG